MRSQMSLQISSSFTYKWFLSRMWMSPQSSYVSSDLQIENQINGFAPEWDLSSNVLNRLPDSEKDWKRVRKLLYQVSSKLCPVTASHDREVQGHLNLGLGLSHCIAAIISYQESQSQLCLEFQQERTKFWRSYPVKKWNCVIRTFHTYVRKYIPSCRWPSTMPADIYWNLSMLPPITKTTLR